MTGSCYRGGIVLMESASSCFGNSMISRICHSEVNLRVLEDLGIDCLMDPTEDLVAVCDSSKVVVSPRPIHLRYLVELGQTLVNCRGRSTGIIGV